MSLNDGTDFDSSIAPANNLNSTAQRYRRPIRGYRLLWWFGALLAGAVPLSLIGKVGYAETWHAFDKYTKGALELSTTHAVRVPSQADHVRNYTATDQDLIAWQQGITQLYDSINKMAVVGVVSDSDRGVEFEFEGREAQGKKGRFYAQRDLSVLVYFALSAAAYLTDSVHLALVVLNLNLYNLALCMRLKGLGDAISKAVEGLKDSQQAFLLLPLEGSLLELVQQQVCLQKMGAIIADWSGTELGMSVRLPALGTITISTSMLASLAAATSVRAIHVTLYGCIPGLPRIRWRQMLGAVGEAKARLTHQASDFGQAMRHRARKQE